MAQTLCRAPPHPGDPAHTGGRSAGWRIGAAEHAIRAGPHGPPPQRRPGTGPLWSPAPLRTVLATFTAHGSSVPSCFRASVRSLLSVHMTDGLVDAQDCHGLSFL